MSEPRCGAVSRTKRAGCVRPFWPPSLTCRYPFQLTDKLERIEADRVCEVEELHDIEPPLPALEIGDKRLVASKRLGDIGLVETSLFTVADQAVAQAFLPG